MMLIATEENSCTARDINNAVRSYVRRNSYGSRESYSELKDRYVRAISQVDKELYIGNRDMRKTRNNESKNTGENRNRGKSKKEVKKKQKIFCGVTSIDENGWITYSEGVEEVVIAEDTEITSIEGTNEPKILSDEYGWNIYEYYENDKVVIENIQIE